MKDESIKRLLQASQLQPSEDFTSQLMHELDRQIARKMRVKLYLLMAGISVFFVGIALALIASGFSFRAFGVGGALPKVGTMMGLSVLAFLLLNYVSSLAKLAGTA